MQFLYSGHYYERQLTDYYYNDKLKIPPLSVFASPYFIHGASCAMLNTDWMPLPVCLQGVMIVRNDLNICLKICLTTVLKCFVDG